ncbi:hypothetical protein ABID21_003506 [Pseudorhizobium tarimense]|uniref:Uncharacterized protein n=1 Tax=Pseudorhizobium tarimense TaxID=1079109 RepID=A0ABV2HA11_9HYPH|nr:hypothetical protein [Pseudorhizobium tarimense]MCJ8520610.1 hypothetical protein [Pseudorhizobium tarimense]
MSDLRFSFPACVVAGKGEITPDDVGLMRRHMWPEGITSRSQAAMAIALDDVCPLKCPEWTELLVESVTAFVVGDESADGVVTGETAGWLLERLSDDATVRTQTGLSILLHVLETARQVPDFLSATVLNQVRLALLPEPRGPRAQGRGGGTAVTQDDLAFVWRVLRSALDRGAFRLSRGERLVLNAIDRLGSPEEHHPGWVEMIALARLAAEKPTIRTEAWLALVTPHMAANDEAA